LFGLNSSFVGLGCSHLTLPALIDCSDLLEIDLSLPKAQSAVRATQDALRIRFILTVIMPEANAANFVLPTSM
jgi:hypothetical protein